jgi:pyruvate kinase
MNNNKENNFFSDSAVKHRHATIICTIGPACDSYEMLKKLIEAGMDVARLNFSHGDHEQKKRIIQLIRKAEKETGKPIAILQDLQGPKLRVGEFRGGKPVNLINGNKVIITTDPCFGTAEKFSVNYPKLPKEVRKNDPILLADGTITLKVLSATKHL